MGEEIRVAVASNFTAAIASIAKRFEAGTDHKVTLIFGSTGKHYAQIKNGAPFDAFFAADVRRPEYLEKEGAALPGSRFTYAVGKVVLWSPRTGSGRADEDWLPIRCPRRYTTHPDIGSRADMVIYVAVLDGTKETYNSPPQLKKAA